MLGKMKTRSLGTSLTLLVGMLALTSCARYSHVMVRVVDRDSQIGIAGARLRTYYVKPMLSMTYQRKDHAKTDREGWARLTVATNYSQWFIGWEYGIFPRASVEATGYRKQEAGLQVVGMSGDLKKPIVIEMQKVE